MVNNSILLRTLTASIGTFSVDGASNFFASSITFTASGDHLDANGFLKVAFVSATANVLSAVLDDGSASVKVALVHDEAATSYASANVLFTYVIPVDAQLSYNFRLSTEGTINVCDVYFVPWC